MKFKLSLIFLLLASVGNAADLSYKDTALPTKLVGANPSTGVSDNFLEVQTDGSLSCRNLDSSGNGITSQTNGAQRALDIGIDVAGVQVDPRIISSIPNSIDKNSTGTISALNGTIAIATNGASTVYLDITGSWIANLVFEAQAGDGTWNDVLGLSTVGQIFNQTTANSSFIIPVGGYTQFRVRASAYTSGTATITQNAGSGSNAVQVFNLTASSLNTTSLISDGTNTASVKAASTAAIATDKALVVAISPNNLLTISTKTPLTANSPSTVSVGVSTGTVLASNSSRKGLILTNLSANTVSFGIGASAVLNDGITLYPGGVWYMDEFSFTTAQINGIASAASSNVSIQEFQ